MELQFHKTVLPGLKLVKREIRNVEETQELKIPSSMPDIGRTLGAWGQVLLRSKEWHNGSAHVSGGVQVWVLYMPEDGVGVQCIQTWIPFHAKWDLPDLDTEGSINTQCCLRSLDVRNTASRKMILRANIGTLGEMWIQTERELYEPAEMPEDICLLRRQYSACIPKEVGEKAFSLEEELEAPAEMETLLYYCIHPQLQEQKLLADKLVFRGTADLHILYQNRDGQIQTWDTEIPYSHFSELDKEYGPDAVAFITPAITGVEAELDQENRLLLKAGFTGQYIICDFADFEAAEDAYSPQRAVEIHADSVELPIMRDMQKQTLTAEQTIPSCGRVLDIRFLPDHPSLVTDSDGITLMTPGLFQVLCQDENGVLQYASTRWEGQRHITDDTDGIVLATVRSVGKPQSAHDGSGTFLSVDTQVEATVLSDGDIAMITGAELGDPLPADPARPSLILRRAGKDTLWELAKKLGSTPEHIQMVNRLEGEPAPDQMLLIPIL